MAIFCVNCAVLRSYYLFSSETATAQPFPYFLFPPHCCFYLFFFISQSNFWVFFFFVSSNHFDFSCFFFDGKLVGITRAEYIFFRLPKNQSTYTSFSFWWFLALHAYASK